MSCFLLRNSHINCNGGNYSGCYVTASSVVRPELLTVVPAICCTREDNQTAIATTVDIPLTAAPFVGVNFSFTPTSTDVVINKVGVFQIIYSTTASSAVGGIVSIGLRKDGVSIPTTVQGSTIGDAEQTNLTGNYILEVDTVPTIITLYNSGVNPTIYDNLVLSIFKITQ